MLYVNNIVYKYSVFKSDIVGVFIVNRCTVVYH